ncbi:alpha/beta fold hydrolase [Sporosarcina sp. E16_3]|uniref:alpha/beta hydrolase n=1 Tax=Sporosarcina sp. E16_3 TaxID=2789293 RepID=UPI001A923B4C|nr:alpha/beta fold hydrolase [Sporosarcina sp. E16_3]MBO0602143.1 alpha/beta fold hydrolase [Sporosarcina sp. E16_3]
MKTGVLFIHGFTGGPLEVRPLVNFLKVRTNWQLAIPTLPGHGITLNLQKGSADSWLMEAELALKRLQKEVDRVIVVGFSMGGLIAMYLSLRYKIDKLVLLSAAAKYISPRILLKEMRIMLAKPLLTKYPPNSFYHLYEYKMTHTPLRAVFEFLRIVSIVKPYYGLIKTPVCIVQGEKDGIVPITAAEHLLKKLGSEKKEFIKSPVGKHHICYSDDCDNWFNEVLRFMRED